MVHAQPRRSPLTDPAERLRADVGRSVDEVATPALVLDLPAARRNIATMAARMGSVAAGLRPHVKVHKSAELARMQLDAGALGVTVATAAEALAMAEGGVGDVLVANQVVVPASIDLLIAAARLATVSVAIDDDVELSILGPVCVRAEVEIGVLVEVDVGLGRGGVRSLGDAVRIAERAAATEGVSFEGLMGYEGHCASEPDAAVRSAEALASMDRLAAAVDACQGAGLPITTVSAGATGTFEVTGNAPSVTEVQAGSYVLMDHFHAPLVNGFEFAVSVMTSVIGRHDELLVLDAGRKSVDVSLRPLEPPDPSATLAFIHEEHVGLLYDAPPAYAIGDRMRVVPGYAPTTVNLFGAYHVVEDSEVVDVWPVLARHGSA